MGGSGKSLTGDKIDNIHCSCSHFIVEGHYIGWAWLSLGKCLLITFLCFMFLEMVPRISCTITFSGIEMSLTSLWFRRSLCFFKVEVTFSFLQMLGTSPNFCDHSGIESGLACLVLMKNTFISSSCVLHHEFYQQCLRYFHILILTE